MEDLDYEKTKEKLVNEIIKLETSNKDPLKLKYRKQELEFYNNLEKNPLHFTIIKDKMENKKFKKGDKVIWRNQSSSYYKTKIGIIKDVVPAEFYDSAYGYADNMVLPRNHESYLVLVGKKLYWPRVCHLIKC